ncbi:MAG: BON domain-containing protein [Acidobacteria bacterium]|nr:BON domain-containing protein [Acidobacteriota bacterium]
MLRGLFRLILLAVVVLFVGAYFLGYDVKDIRRMRADQPEAGGTTGSEKARQVGAQIGERSAAAADTAKRAIEDGRLTTKIKAKMALDDRVKALNLDVDTSGGVVTVTGTVASDAERQRALALARETDGVSQVIDRMQVR